MAEWTARDRATLKAVSEARMPDRDEVDRESSVEILTAWWSTLSASDSLIPDTGPIAAQYTMSLERIGSEGWNGLNFNGIMNAHREEVELRAEASHRLAAIRTASEALPGALVARVGPLVEEAGGADRLVGMVHDARAELDRFPGPDARLDRLRVEYDEARTRMMKLVPPKGCEPGPLYPQAQDRHDELAEAVILREHQVKAEAWEGIKAFVAEVMAGEPTAVGRLLVEAREVSGAFPGGFATTLEAAIQAAVFDAGPYGFALAI